VIWYFFPALIYKFIYSEDKLQKQLSICPTYIETLLVPPKEWSDIAIGELTLKVPIYRFNKISGSENQISFRSEEGTILLFDITPTKELLKMIDEKKVSYPYTSLQSKLDIVKSLPSDVSFLNPRSKNVRGSTNQTLKSISIPSGGLGEVLIINPALLKAICIISENEDGKGFSAIADVYSHNEAMSFGLMLLRYQEKATLQRDLLAILGGMRVPDHLQDLASVKKDIDVIVSKFNKT
jgi:hypothetical protein